MDFYFSGDLTVVEVGESVSVVDFDSDWEVGSGGGGCDYSGEGAVT